MAKKLNKSRMRNSKIILISVLFICFLTKAFVPYETETHEIVEYIGYVLIAICALGRMYSTAFLGGYKNEKLITYGAFSVVRNPLYFFSLLGMTGIALISGHIVIIVAVPVVFVFIYHYLIGREEGFLLEAFGQEYKDYTAKTPRIIPDFRLHNAPETVGVVPKYLNKAFKDAIWWFAAFPVLELAEYVQEHGWIDPIFVIP